jgi:hypothetical protein
MPFQVILQTNPTEDIGNAWLSLDLRTPNGVLGTTLKFGDPSHIEHAFFELTGYPTQIETALYPDEPAVRFDVFGAVETQTGKVGFSLKNIFSNDVLHMNALSRQFFVGNVFHNAHGVPKSHAPCVATCANGQSAQGCVTCVQGDVWVKICC